MPAAVFIQVKKSLPLASPTWSQIKWWSSSTRRDVGMGWNREIGWDDPKMRWQVEYHFMELKFCNKRQPVVRFRFLVVSSLDFNLAFLVLSLSPKPFIWYVSENRCPYLPLICGGWRNPWTRSSQQSMNLVQKVLKAQARSVFMHKRYGQGVFVCVYIYILYYTKYICTRSSHVICRLIFGTPHFQLTESSFW